MTFTLHLRSVGGGFRVREQTPDQHQYTQPLCNTCEDIPLREEIMLGMALVFCGLSLCHNRAAYEIPAPGACPSLSAFNHHLPRSSVYFRRRSAHAARPGYLTGAVGLGRRRVCDGLRGIRDPERLFRRSHWSAPRVDADRDLVVGI